MKNVPCPAEMFGNCPVFRRGEECYQDRHHTYWPANEYNTRVEKQFRNLEANRVMICRWLHDTLHAVALPPEKPSRDEMLGVINEC